MTIVLSLIRGDVMGAKEIARRCHVFSALLSAPTIPSAVSKQDAAEHSEQVGSASWTRV
jgi:hypothetical protein